MNSRLVPTNEIDVIFYEELSLKQVTTTYRIIHILSEYVFLTTDMMMTIYRERFKQQLGLGALKKAVKERLVIEYQDDLEEASEKPIFYYALKGSTMAYLHQNRHPYLKMPFCAGQEEKSRLLTFNSFCILHNIQLSMEHDLDTFLRYFITSDNKLYFFESAISSQMIATEIEKHRVKIIHPAIAIEHQIIEIGSATKAVHPKLIT